PRASFRRPVIRRVWLTQSTRSEKAACICRLRWRGTWPLPGQRLRGTRFQSSIREKWKSCGCSARAKVFPKSPLWSMPPTRRWRTLRRSFARNLAYEPPQSSCVWPSKVAWLRTEIADSGGEDGATDSFAEQSLWRYSGRISARQPRDQDRHDVFGLRARTSR